MGLFGKQLANVVEWEEFREDSIFFKWANNEIKKGSRLILRSGQDAIFLSNGKIEGIFKEDGEYDIETQIIPFLSTLKGFKFGFNSGMRAEVLFVNTKQFQCKWGTKNPINLPTNQLPGGMPIRANGAFSFKVNDYIALIDQVAGVKSNYVVEDVKGRIMASLDQLLMKWISKEAKDYFNLMANASDISKGIQNDLDMEVQKLGMTITDFSIMSVSYPDSVQKMLEKNAAQSMVGDIDRYQRVAMTDAMASGRLSGGGAATDMAGMMFGMQMANQMMNTMGGNGQNGQQSNNQQNNSQQNGNAINSNSAGSVPNFCPNCGTKTNGANFCANCGTKLK